MLGPAESISFVARRLIQFETRFAQAEPLRKSGASKLFKQIAESIQALSLELGKEKLPHDPCRDLIFFASLLHQSTNNELGDVEALRLATILGEAADKEKVFLEFRSSATKNHLLEELEKAHILIQALANGIYVPSNDNIELSKE